MADNTSRTFVTLSLETISYIDDMRKVMGFGPKRPDVIKALVEEKIREMVATKWLDAAEERTRKSMSNKKGIKKES